MAFSCPVPTAARGSLYTVHVRINNTLSKRKQHQLPLLTTCYLYGGLQLFTRSMHYVKDESVNRINKLHIMKALHQTGRALLLLAILSCCLTVSFAQDSKSDKK